VLGAEAFFGAIDNYYADQTKKLLICQGSEPGTPTQGLVKVYLSEGIQSAF